MANQPKTKARSIRITRPHRVDYEWSNGVRGCDTFADAEDAARCMYQIALAAKARELSVIMTWTERVGNEQIIHEVWDVNDAE